MGCSLYKHIIATHKSCPLLLVSSPCEPGDCKVSSQQVLISVVVTGATHLLIGPVVVTILFCDCFTLGVSKRIITILNNVQSVLGMFMASALTVNKIVQVCYLLVDHLSLLATYDDTWQTVSSSVLHNKLFFFSGRATFLTTHTSLCSLSFSLTRALLHRVRIMCFIFTMW